MGKMKVFELSKELNIPNKDFVERLKKMGYSVKSHLSTLEANEVEEIRNKIGGTTVKSSATKKEKKPIAPVIIRREVTRIEEDTKEQEKGYAGDKNRDGLGVVQRRSDVAMNIKYRTEPRKPSNIIVNRKSAVSKNEKQETMDAVPAALVKEEELAKGKLQQEKVSSEATLKVEEPIKQEKGQFEKQVEKSVVESAERTFNSKENSSGTKEEGKKQETLDEKVLKNEKLSEPKQEEVDEKGKEDMKKNEIVDNDMQKAKQENHMEKSNVSGKDKKKETDKNNWNKQNGKDFSKEKDKSFSKNSFDKGQNFDKSSSYDKGQGNDRNQNKNGLNRGNNDRQNPRKDNQFNRNGDRPFNKDEKRNRNNDRPFNKDGRENSNRNTFDKNNGNRSSFNKGNGQFNRDGRNQRQRTPENKIEKGIKEIMSATVASDMPSKEQVRENVRTEYKDKQKVNRKFEEETISKKTSKSKNARGGYEEINYGKLKDLQSESKFSDMFDDTESKMFDYYDVSKTTKRKNGKKKNGNNKKKPTESKNHIEQKIFNLTDIEITDGITVKELSEKLKKTASEVIKKLMGFGLLATLNQELDYDTAFLVASEFGVVAHKKEVISDEDILFDESDDKEEDLIPRPPIVVVMGHVDHGKTSLLDAIRSTNVIEKEAGGITQHIGAYKVKVGQREITFLDTPGHEAFTAMRARGAQVTDIAIIIVAANDGIMPQTVEAINHAKAAGVSIVVAINKIDLPGANVEKVKQELTEYGLVPEEWGGDTICVPISAKQRTNIDGLLEILLLVADMKELKSNPNKQAKGTVIEARLDKNTGITASLLVQRGTLNIGDTIVVGSVIGKIRTMKDDKGQRVKSAGPSTPVEVVGLPEVPEAGEVFYEVENEKVAKHLIEKRKSKLREEMIQKSAPITLDNLFHQIEEGKLKDLNIILKADVQGSVQAIRQSLEKIQNEEARVRIIHANVGAITESDVTLAKVTNSIIIGFNVRPDSMARSIADKEGVQIKIYSVIYNAIDDVTDALKGMLKPKYKEFIQGTAEVRQVFKITNVGMIAGCYVTDGKIVRNSGVRVLRDNVVVHEGKLVSLKREKDDAKEVASGYECGVQVENYNDIKVGDQIESFIMEEIKR